MVDLFEPIEQIKGTTVNSVRTIEEVFMEFVPQTFKRYFQNFVVFQI